MKVNYDNPRILFVPGLILTLIGVVILVVINIGPWKSNRLKECIYIDSERHEIGYLMADRCELTNQVFKAGRESTRKIPLQSIE
jgi:hypothetical protein